MEGGQIREESLMVIIMKTTAYTISSIISTYIYT